MRPQSQCESGCLGSLGRAPQARGAARRSHHGALAVHPCSGSSCPGTLSRAAGEEERGLSPPSGQAVLSQPLLVALFPLQGKLQGAVASRKWPGPGPSRAPVFLCPALIPGWLRWRHLGSCGAQGHSIHVPIFPQRARGWACRKALVTDSGAVYPEQDTEVPRAKGTQGRRGCRAGRMSAMLLC